jgi:hypothetical protein
MMKPILFLDVDGVLNVMVKGTKRKTLIEREIGLGHPRHLYKVILDSEHGPWLRELAAAGFELVWATTWEDEANEHLLEHLGLPKLPVVPFTAEDELRLPLPELLPPFKFSDRHNVWHWKAPSVLRYAGERPFVWFDDDFSVLHDFKWAEERDETIPTYLEHMRPHKGLMRHHVDKALLWLQELDEA